MVQTIQGPKGLPVSGHLFSFRRNPLAFLQQSAHTYGDVVHIRFGPKRNIYLISDPALIKEVLVTKQSHFRKAKGLQVAKAIVGEGLLTSEGQEHLRQRRLAQPVFQKQHISVYADTMVRFAEQMVDSWKDGEERIITNDMMELTLHIITETMFGGLTFHSR